MAFARQASPLGNAFVASRLGNAHQLGKRVAVFVITFGSSNFWWRNNSLVGVVANLASVGRAANTSGTTPFVDNFLYTVSGNNFGGVMPLATEFSERLTVMQDALTASSLAAVDIHNVIAPTTTLAGIQEYGTGGIIDTAIGRVPSDLGVSVTDNRSTFAPTPQGFSDVILGSVTAALDQWDFTPNTIAILHEAVGEPLWLQVLSEELAKTYSVQKTFMDRTDVTSFNGSTYWPDRVVEVIESLEG